MTRETKWTMVLVAALGLLSLGVGGAWAADPVSSNNSGTFIVRITPNVDLGVEVDTAGAGWVDGGNLDVDMNLGAVQVMATGVKVTVKGNFQKQELELLGANAATWTLDTDEADGEDQLRLYGVFGADQLAAPASGLLGGVDNLITTVASKVGQTLGNEPSATPGTGHIHEFLDNQAPEYQQMDDMAVNQVRRLWLRANTPTTTTTDVQQSFVVTVTAVSGVAF